MVFEKDRRLEGADGRKTFYWEDANKGDNVMYRIPRNIRWNDNVVVREDEYSVFFRDGKAMHVFERPGRYAMTTQNVPVLARLGAALTGVQQLGEIYYIQRRELRGKFGTAEPLAFRDADFGLVRLRVFGDFAYKIIDPLMFITQFVGTEGISSSDKVTDWMKSQLIMCVNDALGELKRDKAMAVVDMPAYLQEMEQVILSKVADSTERYGVKITKIVGLNINLPESVQKAIDQRGAMSALGVNYMQYQTGKAIEGVGVGAAKGEGGGGATVMAGMGAGMGAGLGMAGAMAQGMAQGQQQGSPQAPGAKIKCAKCGTELEASSKFCYNCGARITSPGEMTCPECNTAIPAGSKFCPNCGSKLIDNCPKCNVEVPKGTRFCPSCGEKTA